MATSSRSLPAASVRRGSRVQEYPVGGVWFDLIVALLSTWFVVGIYVDGWAHNNNQVDNTFFTPWHALLYSGVAVCGAFLAFMQLRYVNHGHSWRFALPKGYLLSLTGVVLFLMGGGFDFFWHETFGFEANREALYSPAHLILAFSGLLIMTGPLRAAWERTAAQQRLGWVGMFPAVLSVTLVAATLSFFTMNTNLYMNWWTVTGRPPVTGNDTFFRDVVGISSAIISATILMGALLFLLKRWRQQLPFGAVTFTVLVLSALSLWLSLELNILPLPSYWITLFAALVAGLFGDFVLRLVRHADWGVRLFAFGTPFLWVAAYYVLLNSVYPMWWAIHLSLGLAVFAGLIGWLLSYLTISPALPAETQG